MLVALIGLVAVAALVMSTLAWQRQARAERRLDHLEDELGLQSDEPSIQTRRPTKDTLRSRVRSLELRATISAAILDSLRRKAVRKP